MESHWKLSWRIPAMERITATHLRRTTTSGRVSSPNGIKIMDEALKIECEWWGRANGENDISQVSRGAIGISVGDQWLTRLEDSWGNTVRNRLHASAYTLAGWLAGNWWRLRWEPETPTSRSDVDWRMSHSMASAGDGYCWPSILFASDEIGRASCRERVYFSGFWRP